MALDHPIDALPPGTRLGSYEILRVLGRGGFGVTYAARVIGQPGQMVAIKEWFPRDMCLRGRSGQVETRQGADRQSIKDIHLIDFFPVGYGEISRFVNVTEVNS